MVRQNPQPIETNADARELAALVRALPDDRRTVLLAELETRQDGGKYAAELADFSVTLSQRNGRYWYATCSYAGRSFSAYAGKERDEKRARARLAEKIRNWLDAEGGRAKTEGQSR